MTEGETRTLLLLRHAKASQPAGVDDVDRPLADRGLLDGYAVGEQLVAWGVEPDLVLCSPALRTRQTWERAEAAGARARRIEFPELVYHGDWHDLVELVQATPDDETTVLVVGHGPALPDTAHLLAEGDPSADSQDPATPVNPIQSYPTSGLARFTVTAPWADLAPGTATLDAFVVPRG